MSDTWEDWGPDAAPRPKQQQSASDAQNSKVIYRNRDYVEPPNPELLLNPQRVVKDPPTKILQRNPAAPRPQDQPSVSQQSKPQPKTLSERQEEYEKARKRIFDQQDNNNATKNNNTN